MKVCLTLVHSMHFNLIIQVDELIPWKDVECLTACLYLRKSRPALRTWIQELCICRFLPQDKPLAFVLDLRVNL